MYSICWSNAIQSSDDHNQCVQYTADTVVNTIDDGTLTYLTGCIYTYMLYE